MLRRLLTMLAVITGLALVAEPVSARAEQVVSVSQVTPGAACEIAEHRHGLGLLPLPDRSIAPLCAPARSQVWWAPSVVLKADRARE